MNTEVRSQRSEVGEGESAKPKCKHCGVRPPEPDRWRDDSLSGYCDVCRAASYIAHTSIDDARDCIKRETCVDVIYMAAKMEKEGGNQRTSMMKMLRSRLSKLIGIREPQLYPGEVL